MSEQPLVVCVMLVNGRHEMVKRAVASFRAQTYERRLLLVYDTTPSEFDIEATGIDRDRDRVVDEWPTDERSMTRSIGALRNGANGHVDEDLIAHWDSDDWSHPRRLAEQVALLQATGADAVGYREMLFWRCASVEGICLCTQEEMTTCARCGGLGKLIEPGESWLYTSDQQNYCLGTSLLYKRSAWERNPFPDTPKRGASQIGEGEAEELGWQMKIANRVSVTSMVERGPKIIEPRMIAAIHGGNTLAKITPGMSYWRCTPEYDAYCHERMAL